jgi:hypothetical protein
VFHLLHKPCRSLQGFLTQPSHSTPSDTTWLRGEWPKVFSAPLLCPTSESPKRIRFPSRFTYLGDAEKPQCSNRPCLLPFSFLSSLLNFIFSLHHLATSTYKPHALLGDSPFTRSNPQRDCPARSSAFRLAFCSSAQILLRAAPFSANHFPDLNFALSIHH